MRQVESENLISLKNVIKVASFALTVKRCLRIEGFFNLCAEEIIQAIDAAAEELVREHANNSTEIAERDFENSDGAISFNDQNRVIELLTIMHAERRRFLGNFPIWKNYRLQTIQLLRELADKLQKVENHVNKLNLVAALSGFCAGIINVAKTIIENVPVPTYVQTAAPLLSAVNGFIRSYTSTTRELNLERLSKKSEKAIKDDKRQFQEMMGWFDYNERLMDSVESAIGSELHEFIFVKLKTIYDSIRSINGSYKKAIEAMVEFMVKLGSSVHFAIPMAAAALKLLITYSAALLSRDWTDAAFHVSRIANFGIAAVYGFHGAVAVKDLLNTDGEANSKIGSCVGIILDIGPAMLDFSRLIKNDATSEQVANINKIANDIENEIDRIEHVYTALNSE